MTKGICEVLRVDALQKFAHEGGGGFDEADANALQGCWLTKLRPEIVSLFKDWAQAIQYMVAHRRAPVNYRTTLYVVEATRTAFQEWFEDKVSITLIKLIILI